MTSTTNRISGLLLYVTVLFYCLLTCTRVGDATGKEKRIPERIISLAPSITETLFALGLGDKIVGVTSYCIYPPQAKEITRVGSFMSPNFEAMVSLKPDLVVLVKEDIKVTTFSEKKGLPYLTIDNHNIEAILGSFIKIGKACGKTEAALELVEKTRGRMDSIANLSRSDKYMASKPKFMICVGRGGIGAGEISTIWLAGADTWYDDIIHAAGGVNVVKDSSMSYVTFSTEGVIRLKPDIIIDVMTNMSEFNSEEIKNDWRKLATVPAVEHDMIYCLSGDYVTIPGPRFVRLLRDIREIVEEYYTKTPGFVYASKK